MLWGGVYSVCPRDGNFCGYLNYCKGIKLLWIQNMSKIQRNKWKEVLKNIWAQIDILTFLRKQQKFVKGVTTS